MNALLCPTLLFIEDTDWNNTEKHDLFLNHLQETIEYISKYNIEIYWNDDMDNLLWGQPNLHPWLAQDTTSLTKLLFNYLNRINESCDYIKCDCHPIIESSILSKDIISPTLSLCHYLITQLSEKNEKVSFIVDENNNHSFVFDCNCHLKTLIPQIIYIPNGNDNLKINERISKDWNDIKENYDVFTDLLTIIKDKYLSDKTFKYKPEYEPMFMRSICKITEHREKVLYQIANRLTLLPCEVSKNKGFHDEEINENTRSFRIDKVCRIYYKYGDNNRMIFKNYTGLSEHDKGTRHT